MRGYYLRDAPEQLGAGVRWAPRMFTMGEALGDGGGAGGAGAGAASQAAGAAEQQLFFAGRQRPASAGLANTKVASSASRVM